MPFSPLPKILIEELARLESSAPVVDLGCGDGDSGRLLAEFGVAVIGLDRRAWGRRADRQLVGDAHSLPLRPGSLRLLLAANLFRHVLAQDPSGGFLQHWFDVLETGGQIWICEDDPAPGGPAVKNYHRVQEWLGRVLPEARGPLVTLEDFQRVVDRLALTASWRWGRQENACSASSESALLLLRGSTVVDADAEVSSLLRDIAEQGLAYGRFWWACGRKEA